jgi:hypothetical protein
VIPPREATDRYFEQASGDGRVLAIAFDVDIGELVEGHHVVARGIERGPNGARLHYEFVPAISGSNPDVKGPFFWYWSLSAADDAGTSYADSDSGAFDGRSGGEASHGERDLGGEVPASATRLTLRFGPAPQFEPPSGWRRHLVIDLERGLVIDG